MYEQSFLHDLEHHDIKPTAPRLLILEQLHRGDEMLSLPRLEQLLPTVDKSTISRTLSLFLLHGLIHVVDDGSGALKYNISHHDCEDEKMIMMMRKSIPISIVPVVTALSA